MNRDVGLTRRRNSAYGAGILFIGYSLFEVPSNIALYRFGARLLDLRGIMITWGIISVATHLYGGGDKASTSFVSCWAVAEAGFFPGATFYLSTVVSSRILAPAFSPGSCWGFPPLP